jgi:phage terminase large subunit-like protein
MATSRPKRPRAPRTPTSTDPVTAYALSVVNAEVIAGPQVRQACNRHLRDMQEAYRRGWKFDVEKALRAIGFFRDVLRLNGGQHEGQPFILQPWQEFIVGSLFGWISASTGFRRFRTAYIEIGKGNGKALALDTPIPTPTGWTTMGAIEVGDELFDECGQVCRVLAATPVMIGRPCYRVTFSDGCEIVADAEHLWQTTALRSGGRRGPKDAAAPRKGQAAVRTTEEIARTLTVRASSSKHPQAKWNHRVDVAGPIVAPAADLPIDPYVLGAWLGDGDSDCARLTLAFADGRICEEIEASGVSVTQQQRHSDTTGRFRLGSRVVQSTLRTMGLLGNKHVPSAYLRASIDQRMALVQGLMDTDGYVSAGQGQCEFTTTCPALRDGMLELLRSLGFKPTCSTGRATLYGKDCGEKYRIQFHAYTDRPVFRLPRKVARMRERPSTSAISARRTIVGCERIESVPVRCIRVSSGSSLFLAGKGMIPTHNSPLAAGIGLYCLTSDQEQRAEIYSAASKKDQAMILFRDAVAMVNWSPDLHAKIIQTGGQSPWNLAYPSTSSFFRAISSDDGQSGPRPHCSLIDEIHEHTDGNVVNMLSLGQKGRRQALTVEITNSGFDRTTICFQHHDYTVRVLAAQQGDEDFNDEWFGFVCSLDEGDDPFEDEGCWPKANPNLGVSIELGYLRKEVRESRGMPAKASIVRRLNFCMWVDAENPWIEGPLWMACQDRESPPSELSQFFAKCKRVVGALDLSGTRDLTALSLVGETDEEILAAVEFWTPKETLLERAHKDRVHYDAWAEKGYLTPTPGRSVDYRFVAQRLLELQIEIPLLGQVAFDPYRIKYLERDLDEFNVPIELVQHPQGFYKPQEKDPKTLKPGEKAPPILWMPRSIELLEAAVFARSPAAMEARAEAAATDDHAPAPASKPLRVLWNPCLNWNSGSAVPEFDPKNNRIFSKRKSRGRIDGIVALAMGIGFLGEGETKPTPPPKFQMLVI